MSVDYDILPVAHLRDGARLYIEQGVRPGGFQAAVIAGDMLRAVGQADPECALQLYAICSWWLCEAPSGCSGSPQHMQRWMASRKAERTCGKR